MALERYGLLCPICNDVIFLGKTMGDGIYTVRENEKQLELIYDWMFKHLEECYKKISWGSSDELLFHVVHEGHSMWKGCTSMNTSLNAKPFLRKGELNGG